MCLIHCHSLFTNFIPCSVFCRVQLKAIGIYQLYYQTASCEGTNDTCDFVHSVEGLMKRLDMQTSDSVDLYFLYKTAINYSLLMPLYLFM